MKTLALVMIVKNEERCLSQTLHAIGGLVDKIYITDTGSTDKTVAIAQSFHAVVSHFPWSGDFAAAKNYALSQSDCDWNLVLDADERLIDGSREQIQDFLEDLSHIGAIQIQNLYREKDGEISRSYQFATRLVPQGTRMDGKVHEQFATVLPSHPLPLIFEHDGYLLEGKGERNLQILMDELILSPNDPYLLLQTAQTLKNLERYTDAEPYFDRFLKNVPLEGCGYREKGIIFFIYNLLEEGAFEKGRQLIENEAARLDSYADFHFACGSFYMRMILSDIQKYMNYLPLIEKSYLRCLEIGEVPEHQGTYGCGSFKAEYNLGVWYEVSGNVEKAGACYRHCADCGYEKAAERLQQLNL